MYSTDYDEFKKTLSDLCISVNRPFNDDLCRVFWEDLRGQHLSEVRERAKYVRACGKTRFTAHDLKPEREAPKPESTKSEPPITWQVRCGNMALLKFLLANDVPQDRVEKLVAAKNKIVGSAHDNDDPAALGDVLRAAFERAAA